MSMCVSSMVHTTTTVYTTIHVTCVHMNQVCRSVVHIVELGVIPTAVSQVLRSLSVKAKALQD